MTLKFNLYENISVNDVEIHNEHEIVEVLDFTDKEAMILGEWFKGKDNIDINNDVYVRITGEDIWDIINTLDIVLNETDEYLRLLLALFYFPTMYRVPNMVYNPLMFTDEYFGSLAKVYDCLRSVIPEASIENKERWFYYNLSWI